MYKDPGIVTVMVGFTLTGFSTIIVALRFYCRYFLMGTTSLSDYVMLAALGATWGNTVLNYYQNYFGSRALLRELREGHRLQFEQNLSGVLVTWYIYRITYVIALCLVKLSILFFYRAIASHVTFRRLVYVTMAIVSIYTFGICLAGIFQCQVPSDAWSIPAYLSQPGIDGTKDTHRRHCNSPTAIYVFSAGANLFSDVVILLLPIPTMLGLRIPLNRRLALIGIFSVGIMAIVASCVRLWVLALWSESPSNQAHFGPDMLLWGQVEVNSGIVSASIPFLRLLFKKFMPDKTDELPVPRKPQMIATSNKPLELSSLAIFSGPDKGPNGSPIWKPFITVPASLSSRDSTSQYEPTQTA